MSHAADARASAARLLTRFGVSLSYQELVEGVASGDPISALSRVRPLEEDKNAGIQSGASQITALATPFTAAGKRLDDGEWETTINARARALSEAVAAHGPAAGDPVYYRTVVAL
ncbi:MAG: hypothetical protein GY719_25890 [bacterium]|nr:hypothetical protein [bacterium]